MTNLLEFKFWNKTLNKFVIVSDSDLARAFRDENITVLQFTGAKDKRGNKIYEGDILKRFKKNGEPYMKKYPPVRWSYYHHGFIWLDHYQEKIIIGNIFENPEFYD